MRLRKKKDREIDDATTKEYDNATANFISNGKVTKAEDIPDKEKIREAQRKAWEAQHPKP